MLRHVSSAQILNAGSTSIPKKDSKADRLEAYPTSPFAEQVPLSRVVKAVAVVSKAMRRGHLNVHTKLRRGDVGFD